MKLVATNGLAPSIGRKASSTVRVPDALVELVDEVEEDDEDDVLEDEEVEDEELVCVVGVELLEEEEVVTD